MRFAMFGVLVAITACGGDDDRVYTIGGPYDVSRELTNDTPCPSFTYANEYGLRVNDDGTVLLANADGIPATDVVKTATTLDFSSSESWTSTEGNADPTVAYHLTAFGHGFHGTATTSFIFDTATAGTTCEYAFDVDVAFAGD